MTHKIVAPEEVGMSSKRLELIRPAMQMYVNQKKIAGLSTMIARRGNVVHFEQFGQAAKTYYWVDPQEELVGLLMSQSMMQFDMPEKDFQVLTYQALVN